MHANINDFVIRENAFSKLDQLSLLYDECIPWSEIEKGFIFDGHTVLFASRAVGIFKPSILSMGALSIKKVLPKTGRKNSYSDSDSEDETGCFRYSLQGVNPDNHHNKLIREAFEAQLPIIYFYGIAPGIYKAIYPCQIDRIEGLFCYVSIINSNKESLVKDFTFTQSIIEKRYSLRATKSRLHQATFRSAILGAYNNTCAMSGLPIAKLLDAAHITPDSDPNGYASIDNGICLSKIHHKAFDANLIGIDPDFKIHVSRELLSVEDGPLLELCLKGLNGKKLSIPKLLQNQPNKEALAERFSLFK